MEYDRRLRPQTIKADWCCSPPYRPRHRTVCHLAVTLLIVAYGALLGMGHSRILYAHDQSVLRSEVDDLQWSELIGSTRKMHDEMSAITRTGNIDADFARLMLPHHRAAVAMARVQLLYGTDPQMRRLAQEIITDQQLEIELMQLWLLHQPARSSDTAVAAPAHK